MIKGKRGLEAKIRKEEGLGGNEWSKRRARFDRCVKEKKERLN